MDVLPVWAYWPAVGVLAFSLGDLLIILFGEQRMLPAQVALAGLAALLPLSAHYSCVGFCKTAAALAPVLWDDEESNREWLRQRLPKIFTFALWPSRLVTGAIVLLGLITVLWLGVPSIPQRSSLLRF